jgi:glycosyltransferase involved in cell wall biosynthesis
VSSVTDGRLRVAMVIQGFHPRVGGAEGQLRAVAPRLRDAGIDVHVVTRRYPGMTPFALVDGVPVHRLASPGPKLVASLAFTAGAVERIRRLQPHVIHAHELLSPSTIAVAAGRLTATPIVVKVLISGEVRYLRDERPFGAQRMALLRRQVDAFVTISKDIDAELAASGVPAGRRRFIPNGVDTHRFRPASDEVRLAARRAIGAGPGPTLVYVGRLEPQKNLLQLVEVFARVREHVPGAHLLLAGQGSQHGLLHERAGPGVRLLGAVDDVTHLLAAADAFVLPSWREGLSNALLEAMACALPVVVTSVGGAAELVEHGRSGFLVAPGDAAQLEQTLRRVLGDPDTARQSGALARDAVVRRYSLDDRIEEFVALYRELTA